MPAWGIRHHGTRAGCVANMETAKTILATYTCCCLFEIGNTPLALAMGPTLNWTGFSGRHCLLELLFYAAPEYWIIEQ